MQKKTKQTQTIFLLYFFLVLSGNCCLGERKEIEIKRNPETKNVILPTSTDEDLESENFTEEEPIEEPANQFETSISKDKEKTDKTDYDLVNKSTNKLIELNQKLDRQTKNKENNQQGLAEYKNQANHNGLKNFASADSSKNNNSLLSVTNITNLPSDNFPSKKKNLSSKPSLKLKKNAKIKDSGIEKKKLSISTNKSLKKYKAKPMQNVLPVLSVVKTDTKSQEMAQKTISKIESKCKGKKLGKNQT